MSHQNVPGYICQKSKSDKHQFHARDTLRQRPFLNWARLGRHLELQGIEPCSKAVTGVNDHDKANAARARGEFLIQRPVDSQFGPEGCLYMLDYGETWGASELHRRGASAGEGAGLCAGARQGQGVRGYLRALLTATLVRRRRFDNSIAMLRITTIPRCGSRWMSWLNSER